MVDVKLKTVQQASWKMQDLRCVIRQAGVGNNQTAGVKNREPGVESNPDQGKYRVSRGGTGTAGGKKGQQQGFGNK